MRKCSLWNSEDYKIRRITTNQPNLCKRRYTYRQVQRILQTHKRVVRSLWPCGARRRSATYRLLEWRVRVPLRSWMFVSCVYCVGSTLSNGQIARSEEFYRVCMSNCVWSRNHNKDGQGLSGAVAPEKRKMRECGVGEKCLYRKREQSVVVSTNMLHVEAGLFV